MKRLLDFFSFQVSSLQTLPLIQGCSLRPWKELLCPHTGTILGNSSLMGQPSALFLCSSSLHRVPSPVHILPHKILILDFRSSWVVPMVVV